MAKTLIGVLDRNLTTQRAIDLPNLVAMGSQLNGEAKRRPQSVIEDLAARGIVVVSGSDEDSGIYGFIWR